MSGKWIFFWLMAIIGWGCKSKNQVQSSPTQFPEWTFSQGVSKSLISVPVSISLNALEKKINGQIPWTFQNPEWPNFSILPCGQPEMKFEVRRDSLHLKAEGTTLYFEMDMNYAISGQVCPTCWEGSCMLPKVTFSCGNGKEGWRRVHWIGKMMWGVDDRYHLVTRSESLQLTPYNPCELTFLKLDFTDMVIKEMAKAIQSALDKADQDFAQMDFYPHLWEWAKKMKSGVAIGSSGYLSVVMDHIMVSNIRSDSDSVYADLGVEAGILFSTGPQKDEVVQLPQIQFTPVQSSGFDISLNANFTWNHLNQLINEHLLEKKWQWNSPDDYVVFHDCVFEYAKNGKVKCNWMFDFKFQDVSRKKVKLAAEMTPFWNEEKQILELRELDWDLNARHQILQWGIQLENWNKDWAKGKLMEISMTPYYPVLLEQSNRFWNNLNIENGKIKGRFDHVNIQKMTFQEAGCQLELMAKGNMKVKVSGIPWN